MTACVPAQVQACMPFMSESVTQSTIDCVYDCMDAISAPLCRWTMLNGIPQYSPAVQSGVTLAACILENIAHSICAMPESTPLNVGEDDPWTPLSFPNMSLFRDFIANAMWQQYVSGHYAPEYPDTEADDDGEAEEEPDAAGDDDRETNEEPDAVVHGDGDGHGEGESDYSVTETASLEAESVNEASVRADPPPQVNINEEPCSPPVTFKVFIERVFDSPPSQEPGAYVTTPSPDGSGGN